MKLPPNIYSLTQSLYVIMCDSNPTNNVNIKFGAIKVLLSDRRNKRAIVCEKHTQT